MVVAAAAFFAFSFYGPFNRAGMHDTDCGAMGNGSRPAVPTMGELLTTGAGRGGARCLPARLPTL